MQEYLKDLVQFLLASAEHWAVLVTGGIVIALLWLWSALKQRPLPRRLVLGLAAAFLVFAFFNAWREQYQRSHPGLSLEIDSVMVGYEDQSPESSKWLIIASVANNGSPSVADQWKLSVLAPGWNHEASQPFSLIAPNEPVRFNYEEGDSLVYSQDDALYGKTMPQPLATGSKQTGLLMFLFPGLSKSVVTQKGTIVTLECRDVASNRIKTTRTLQGVIFKHPGYYPGTKPPTYEKQKNKN